MRKKSSPHLFVFLCITFLLICALNGCGKKAPEGTTVTSTTVDGVRDSSPIVLEPVKGGTDVIGNEAVEIDLSNSSEGYIIVSYSGDCDKVKMQLTGNNSTTYTYLLTKDGSDVIPLSQGDGSYVTTVFENIGQDQYATLFTDSFNVTLGNKYGPFLYPNQYVNFNENTQTVAIGSELANGATSDLQVVSDVYNYVIANISYDHDKAETVQYGYLPDIDEILSIKKGICFDYAAVMASMLRSQRIPTRLEIGYAGTTYHAWISVYTDDTGWINGMIEFNGANWSLMDPTFAANTAEKKLKNFIGDGSNYVTKYMY